MKGFQGRAGKRAIQTRRLFFCLLAPGFLATLRQPGGAQRAVHRAPWVSQRRINEAAAALERANRLLVDDSGLRLPNETFPNYTTRLMTPQPNEKPAAYKARVGAYLTTLADAADATAWARRMPNLRDDSPENELLWQRASRILSYLPGRLVKLNLAWRSETAPALIGRADLTGPLAPFAAASSPTETSAGELYETLTLLRAALHILRDARP